MKNSEPITEQLNVEVIIRPGCRYSDRVLNELNAARVDFPQMTLAIVDINESGNNRRPLGGITPSIWVNGKLLFLGTYSQPRFYKKMKKLSSLY